MKKKKGVSRKGELEGVMSSMSADLVLKVVLKMVEGAWKEKKRECPFENVVQYGLWPFDGGSVGVVKLPSGRVLSFDVPVPELAGVALCKIGQRLVDELEPGDLHGLTKLVERCVEEVEKKITPSN